MKIVKKLLSHDGTKQFLLKLVYHYITWVHRTSTWRVIDYSGINKENVEENKPAIYITWHGRIAGLAPLWNKDLPLHALISPHKDGALLAQTLACFGVHTIWGSSDKQPTKALRGLLKLAKKRQNIVITPDGPRGPRMHISSHVTELAAMTNYPVVPVAFATKHGKNLKTWDRFLVPFPFTKGVIIFGKPYYVARTSNETFMKKEKKELERRLNLVTYEADTLMKRSPVFPDNKSINRKRISKT